METKVKSYQSSHGNYLGTNRALSIRTCLNIKYVAQRIQFKRESRTFCPISRSEALELPIVVERTECRGLTRNMNICQLSALACRL